MTRHPLQPYDARNFERERPFSFDTAALAGARSAWSVRREPPPLLDGPLPARPPGDVSLQDLKAFLVHPVRGFLRERLDVATPFEPDDLADAIPVDARQPREVADRRPAAARAARRAGPGRGDDRRAAQRHAAARRPRHRGAQRGRRGVPAAVVAHRRAPRGRAPLGRRRRRPRRRPPADRHRARRLRQPGRSASATPGSTPGSGCTPGSTCSRWRRRTPTSTGPRTPSAASAPGRSARSAARSTTAPSTGCATWSSSATAGCARRCRCR